MKQELPEELKHESDIVAATENLTDTVNAIIRYLKKREDAGKKGLEVSLEATEFGIYNSSNLHTEPQTGEDEINEFIRDVTAVGSRPKSEVQQRLMDLITKAEDRARADEASRCWKHEQDVRAATIAEVKEKVEAMKTPDIDLTPGFNITTEYRLGEIRGKNTSIDHILVALSSIGDTQS